ncbi:MAG TPA: hypothetical protein VN634_04090 [Candidatus Limnocylindrales bacterium]|nr:hypothetical protein [Candidatus Limnocylindrales bacterium]
MDTPDSPLQKFEAVRSDIRATAKWMVGGLGALGALAIGTSPFTSLGSLIPLTPRFYAAVVALAAALLLFGIGMIQALRLLITETFFLEDVRQNSNLLKLIEAHASDLLPPQYESLIPLLDERQAATVELRKHSKSPGSNEYTEALNRFTALTPTLSRLSSYLQTEQLKMDVRNRSVALLLVTSMGLIALGVYAWAANPPHDDKPKEERVPICVTRDRADASHTTEPTSPQPNPTKPQP